MMKNPTKPFATASKRKIMPVKPGMKPPNGKLEVPPQYKVKKPKRP